MVGLTVIAKGNSATAERPDKGVAAVRLDGVAIEFKTIEGQSFRAVD
jgi:hypothetical protein